jgi:diacylglycerol kinase (ATP)
MRALVIYNPIAGSHAQEDDLHQTVEYLVHQGWDVADVERTHGTGDATTYARAAVVQGCNAVFVAGGDGTIAQAIDGMWGSEVALGLLPAGTGNVMARQLNLPVPGGLYARPMLESARLLLSGQVRPVDIGRIGPKAGSGPVRHFLCWGGVGFDAQVNMDFAEEKRLNRGLGLLAFTVSTLLTMRDFAGTSAKVRVDGQRVSRRMIMLVANNIQLYGVIFRMAPTAILDDGWLDLYLFQGRSPARTFLHAARLLFNAHVQDPEVDVYRARHIEINTYRPLPVHVDGEAIGYTPVVIDVVPRALKLMVPSCAPASLFVDGTGMLAPETSWEWMLRMARDAGQALRQRGSLP